MILSGVMSGAVRVRGGVRRLWLVVVAPVGRRGAALLSFGAGFMLWGAQLRLNSPTAAPAFGPIAKVLPVDAWGVVFVAVGVLAMVGSRISGVRSVAFGALAGLAALWGTSILLGPDRYGWPAALVWLLVVVPLVLIVAGVGDSAEPP